MPTPNSVTSPPVGQQAIVYGGSMAGLITAGLLARHFERVILVERDRLEQGPQPRKGVPQARHSHVLLTRGMNVLCDIFPGFEEDLRAAGSQTFDMAGDHAWYQSGFWRPRFRSGIQLHSQSRPLLEWTIRQRVLALPTVQLLDGLEVTGLQTSADKARVTGIHVHSPGGGDTRTLEGELVVDASGRSSRMPQWLEALGYPRVEETRIHVDVAYASRLFQPPPGFAASWKMMGIAPELPRERRVGSICLIEGGRWLVTLAGWLGEQPPLDDKGYLEFARTLGQPHLYEVLRHAEPIGPIHVYNFSHNQRRHYERMSRFPEGLVVLGDAFCSFNPIYGQGMTTGAIQAEVLRDGLRQGLGGLAQRYRKKVGQLLSAPWALATSGDLRFPEVEGQRPPGFELMSRYGDRFQRLAGHDRQAYTALLRVMHMLDSPAAMASPRLALKVLTARPDAESLTRQPEPPLASESRAA